jgi:hypothetical protein
LTAWHIPYYTLSRLSCATRDSTAIRSLHITLVPAFNSAVDPFFVLRYSHQSNLVASCLNGAAATPYWFLGMGLKLSQSGPPSYTANRHRPSSGSAATLPRQDTNISISGRGVCSPQSKPTLNFTRLLVRVLAVVLLSSRDGFQWTIFQPTMTTAI